MGIFGITAICEIAGCYAVFWLAALGQIGVVAGAGRVRSGSVCMASYHASFSECGPRLCRVWGRLYCRVAAVAVDGGETVDFP
jgi:drug/metabolite transporter superfamily protein YnfA